MKTYLAAAPLLLFTASPAPAAQAPEPDHRHCVSTGEFNSVAGLPHPSEMTRTEVEKRWEMVDRGHRGQMGFVGRGMIYKRCDKPLSVNYYGIVYSKGHIWIMVWGNPTLTRRMGMPAPVVAERH